MPAVVCITCGLGESLDLIVKSDVDGRHDTGVADAHHLDAKAM